MTEFPTDGSRVKTTITAEEPTSSKVDTSPLSPENNLQRVKRALIPDTTDSTEGVSSEQQTQLLGLHDDLMDELTDTRDVLQQLQTVVCFLHELPYGNQSFYNLEKAG